METNQAEKTPKAAPKSFMTVGPTLHYSHSNVQRCWGMAVLAFVVSCAFWSKIQTGSFWPSTFETLTSPGLWRLGGCATMPVSIFEYPWQILVLGLLMGILVIVPVLISQLMSFRYSWPFILAVVFLADLPGFAISLLLSCVAVACRPFRFRSRFIAVALCTAPQLIYLGCFGGAGGVEPIKWGFSFTPWICAWLVSLAVTGMVLGIGHFTRYRPGLVWSVCGLVLVIVFFIFEVKIGFDELDYQLYVAKNNPEHVSEFHDHSITAALDKTITSDSMKKYFASFFYPTEPIPLRTELKREIKVELNRNRWPRWFIVPDELKYQEKKQSLFEQYNLFINKRPQSRRMPIALYYKGLLNDYSPDIKVLEQKEVLHFYSDYPYESSRKIWYRLYSEFSNSAESIEARWRIAKDWAGQGRFDNADKLISQALVMVAEELKNTEQSQFQRDTFFSSFRPPAESAITAYKLVELKTKLSQLRYLISKQNRTQDSPSANRLAKFVMLNPHVSDYTWHLDELLEQMKDNDPLRDNVLLAQVQLVADDQLRSEKLNQLHKDFQNTDGGMQALYELGLLEIGQWRRRDESHPEQKKKHLIQARETLTNFIDLYPQSVFAKQVSKNLADLPRVD